MQYRTDEGFGAFWEDRKQAEEPHTIVKLVEKPEYPEGGVHCAHMCLGLVKLGPNRPRRRGLSLP